jgi:transposase
VTVPASRSLIRDPPGPAGRRALGPQARGMRRDSALAGVGSEPDPRSRRSATAPRSSCGDERSGAASTQRPKALATQHQVAPALRRLRRITFPDGLVERAAQRYVRDLAGRINDHNRRIAGIEQEISALLSEHGTPVSGVIGGGPIVAAQLIAHAGDVRRFRDAAAFATYRGTAPLACGSGKSSGRHRRNPTGNRQLNCVIHRIALTQARLP